MARFPRTGTEETPSADGYAAACSEVLAAKAEVDRIVRRIKRRMRSPGMRRIAPFLRKPQGGRP